MNECGSLLIFWMTEPTYFPSSSRFIDGPMMHKLSLNLAAGKENLWWFLFVCLFPLCEGFPKMRNTTIRLPLPKKKKKKRVALYYVKFSMTWWKLISTLNKCADLWFWSNKHKALGDQGKVERKWNKLFLRIQANALPLCQVLFFPVFFFFPHNASDALWLGLCLNWAEAHTQIIFS